MLLTKTPLKYLFYELRQFIAKKKKRNYNAKKNYTKAH
jgi:hypothetical protein